MDRETREFLLEVLRLGVPQPLLKTPDLVTELRTEAAAALLEETKRIRRGETPTAPSAPPA